MYCFSGYAGVNSALGGVDGRAYQKMRGKHAKLMEEVVYLCGH